MIEPVTSDNLQTVRAFLTERAETCQFLLAGLAEHGPSLGDHINSGNFKCVCEGTTIRCVFALYRRGNIVIQGDGGEIDPAPIVDACLAEPIAILGAVGPWAMSSACWDEVLRRDPDLRETFRSREVLYRLLLDGAPATALDPRVRPLAPADFDACQEMSRLFCEEEDLPFEGTADERRTLFDQRCARGESWGVEVDGALVATTIMISRYEDTGVVGGVYTRQEHRRCGLARAGMVRLVHDGVEKLGLSRIILFTGEENVAARRLYEDLGFELTGHFGLLFGTRATP